MDKKILIVAAVAVVAIVAVAAVIVVMNNKGGEKEYNASELAEKFIKDYSGKEFGEFKISDGATAESATLTCECNKYDRTGKYIEPRAEPTVIVITHYETKELAKEAFLKAITDSKNGTKGKTLLTQQDKLGMASKEVTIYDLREESASKYGADNAFLFHASYIGSTLADQQYTQLAGALLDGKNVISFNTSTNSVYYPRAINTNPVDTEVCTTAEAYNSLLVAFCKAF